jgi:hypothetical protein
MQGKLYHMRFRGRVAQSTLADAFDTHDWRIYADFAQLHPTPLQSDSGLAHSRVSSHRLAANVSGHN